LKRGKAIILFDVSTDQGLAGGLIKVLDDGKKTVPEFLHKALSVMPYTSAYKKPYSGDHQRLGFPPVKPTSIPVRKRSFQSIVGFESVKRPRNEQQSVDSESIKRPRNEQQTVGLPSSGFDLFNVHSSSGSAPVEPKSSFGPVKPTSSTQKNSSDAI
jgi:hypothetical protein